MRCQKPEFEEPAGAQCVKLVIGQTKPSVPIVMKEIFYPPNPRETG